MAENVRLPSSSIGELKKIIQGYAHFGENVQLDDLARLLGISKTTISPNNPALTELGIIEGGKTKNATPLGMKLGRALEHNHQEDVIRSFREIIQGSQFLSDVISTVRIKGGLSIDDLASHILYASGQKNSKGNRTGSRTYADILVESGLLVETNGQVTVAISGDLPEKKSNLTQISVEADDSVKEETVMELPKITQDESVHPSKTSSTTPTKIAINIQLQIPATENPQVYENLFKALREQLLNPPQNHDTE